MTAKNNFTSLEHRLGEVASEENEIKTALHVHHTATTTATATTTTTAPTTGTDGPLSGIRVLDLARILAGPYCTMLLGDMGADVIKIENPAHGDDTREWGPPFASLAPHVAAKYPNTKPESAYFMSVNRNKRSVAVNIRHKDGQEIIRELAKQCDVLVENYIPGKLAKYGLGHEDLAQINPRLVYASITGYGSTGPYAKRAGYDVMIEAEAGLMHITGEPGRPPVKVGVAITDLTTGLYTHGAIIAALFARERTGRGQHIDASLIECQVASLANIASSFLVGGQEAKRWGTQHASIVPYQGYDTSDGRHIVLGAGNDTQFGVLCRSIGLDELPTDVRFVTNADRVNNREALNELLASRIKSQPLKHWLDALEGSGIPYAPLNDIKHTFEHPQLLARDMVQQVEHPTTGPVKLVGIPVKYSDTKPSIRLPPPLLGQHTEEVLRELLGYSSNQIDALTSSSVIKMSALHSD
ncbi:CoA-transferase family III [Ramicandelaber brevisporus]|nr:CoA-transferase family III [Ramicandelaber brevisporus]